MFRGGGDIAAAWCRRAVAAVAPSAGSVVRLCRRSCLGLRASAGPLSGRRLLCGTLPLRRQKLIELGKSKGYLTYDEVNDNMPDDIVSSDQIDDWLSALGEQGIEIVDSASQFKPKGKAAPARGGQLARPIVDIKDDDKEVDDDATTTNDAAEDDEYSYSRTSEAWRGRRAGARSDPSTRRS